jgi:hypothetical protein
VNVVTVLSEESVENEAIVEGAVVAVAADVEGTVTLVQTGTALRVSRKCYQRDNG